MTDSIKATDFDPPLTARQVEQVQEVINEALRRQLATLDIKPQKPEDPALSSYKDGDQVEVIKDGDWMPGVINGIERRLKLIYVHTERGPVSIASPKFIRKPQAPQIAS